MTLNLSGSSTVNRILSNVDTTARNFGSNVQTNAKSGLNSARAAGTAVVSNAEHRIKAAESLATNEINKAKQISGQLAKALTPPKLPEIPKIPQIPELKIPQIPQIPQIPNLDFSIPSAASILKKLLPKIKLPSFKFAIEVPKFKLPRPDWKGPQKIQPPKLPDGLGK
jgi:hypothetical protein